MGSSDVSMHSRLVDEQRAELIQRVTMVMPIADELLSLGMLHEETYSQISAARTSQEKMRELFTALHSGGDRVKSAFYCALRDNQPHLLQGLVTKLKISAPHEPKTREEFLQYWCELSLDMNTVQKNLRLSEGNRVVTWTGSVQPYSDHPERFDSCFQVLCRESVSARCYWEAEGGHWNFCRSVVQKHGQERIG
ncbi:tripartite motif-containing protein 16-like [Chanos chanos]|uniref:Tripartite motif-containing protein 16-like n=1 Tax=Chanos chanos TaxID=29144 RepID=A0A6J2VQR6_CHACN|nr:tripartite motif-containing protein 16-like [Chanos chanos]